MKINQYNFIFGGVASGKTIATLKLIRNLNNRTLYFDSENGANASLGKFSGFKTANNLNLFIVSYDLKEILRKILLINEDCFEMLNIVIDPIRNYTDSDFYNFVQDLPKIHRYFFVVQSVKDINIENRQYGGDKMKELSSDLNLDRNNMSFFLVKNDHHGPMDKSIIIYNYNTNESCNIGEISQVIRDMKLSEILDESK